ncbi:tail fiber domain-containing protein [Chryseobacterium phocaeense]|uniref:tail fiber domain-containing protein n=1 Tax=Chryseobacterium phocaeense TaxID=1816690 RepID=UPI0009BB72B2|nr:tail fiber domain-containing protein [Chryseobacterium phocaeense]
MKIKVFALMLLPAVYFGQVGINNTTPQGTLDITARNATGTSTDRDGILIPRIDRQRAQNMTGVQTSTMVYVNSIATGTQTGAAVNIDATGYYFYNGTVWVKLENPTNAAAAENIYNANGTLTNNRTVTQGANTLAFTGTAANAFSVDGTTFSVDASNNRVGIGTSGPLTPLDIRGEGYGFQQSNGTVDIRTWIGTGSGSTVPSGYIGTRTEHPLDLMTFDSSRLRVAANGNVGIGTMNPETRLHVRTANNNYGFLHTDGTIRIMSYVGSGSSNGNVQAGWIGTESDTPLEIMVRDTPHIHINNSAGGFRVGIGTTNPTQHLHVIGNILASGTITPSDIRIKKEIRDNTYGLNEVLKLRTITYKYKDEALSRDKKVGFVAQEIQKAMPELVTTANDEMKTLGVNYAEMTVVLTKAVQQQQEKISRMEEELKALKALIEKK